MKLNKNTLILALAGLGLYLLSVGLSYAVFNYFKNRGTEIISPAPQTPGSSKSKIDLSAPKTEECPLNGAKFTKAERDIWSKIRPLGVMIENHQESRPQSGLSKADIVYETVAEGGITRFLGMFYCGIVATSDRGVYDLGPVRSARTYYLDLVSEYGDFPLYVHVGGAGNCDDPTVDPKAKALCQIEKYGWKNKESWSDLNQFSLSVKECRREPDRLGHPVATEHSMYCSSDALWAKAAERKLTNVNFDNVSWDKNFKKWQFKDDSSAGQNTSFEFNFWKEDKDYTVKWDYDSATNSYKRQNGGQTHTDFNTKEQVIAKNVIIQYVKEKGPVDEHKHMLYEIVGEGKAIIFQDGQKIEGKWVKKTRLDRTVYTDSKGKEIKLNRGPVWIEIVPIGSEITY